MVNDSVREELALKISPLARPVKPPIYEKPVALIQEDYAPPKKIAPEIISAPPATNPPPAETIAVPIAPETTANVSKPAGSQTAEIMSKHTSPILVEFQNKNAVLPEWRLQLQNSVRRRANNAARTESQPATYQKVLVTKGATALKVETAEQPEALISDNPTLENALRRIEESRQKYLTEERPKLSVVQNAPKSSPPVLNKMPEILPFKKETAAESTAAKPKTALSFSAPKFEKFDTNKLPPLPAKVASRFKPTPEIHSTAAEIAEDANNLFEIKAGKTPNVAVYEEAATSEIFEQAAEEDGDDRAPMMARFNAGIFDLMIGAVLSVILLAPFTLANGSLFTFQGLLAFLATCSIVMFIYLTTTIGMMGRTLGMKMFSLELVDIEGNTYPSFHQAAVSSSVYIVSLALGGIGFLTLLLNDEKRAAHDLISGTIVVKEYE